MSYEKFSFEIKDEVAYVGFGFNNSKSMTVLDEKTLTELQSIADDLKSKESSLKGAIFFTHKERCFIAGADISVISSMNTESEAAAGAEAGQVVYNSIEDLKIPTVACVHGVCLGGGAEFALACNKIIMSNDKSTMMGLPEVKLGILPGFGGTYRLPKKIGLPGALDLILTGKNVKPRKAKKIGLVEEVFPKENLVKMASGFFKDKKKDEGMMKSIEHFASDNFISKKIIFQKARENVLKKTKGFYEAPLKILDVMESGMSKGRESYLSLESRGFGELCVSDQSRNLRNIYFMTEEVKKYSGPKGNGKVPETKRGGCLGAGTMGGGIAWLMASNGMRPIMKDLNQGALELGLKQSAKNFMGAVKRKKMSFEEFERKQRSILTQTSYNGFEKIDLLIEAVVENMDIKKKVFAETEKYMRADALITSNTSSLSVEEMSTALEKPERFVGLHFFNPVHKMPLVEIITHSKVSPETLEAAYKWVLKVKKTPVIVKDGPGFLVNRILMPFLNEIGFLIEEGVSIQAIDEAAVNFGMPMGPCRLMDEIGIDVGIKVAKILHDGLGDRLKSAEFSKKVAEKEFYGKKTRKGFYIYDENGKESGLNEEVLKLCPSTEKKMSEVEIQKRLVLPMINEAAMILEDKIVTSAKDVDLGVIFGLGFPPFRGGLLRYADSEGLDNILSAITDMAKSVDADRFSPAPLLKELVEKKTKFYDL